jgi:hypothetical protein
VSLFCCFSFDQTKINTLMYKKKGKNYKGGIGSDKRGNNRQFIRVNRSIKVRKKKHLNLKLETSIFKNKQYLK